MDLLLTDTRSRIIQNPQIRASDGQQATLKIGERIPIATGSYQTGAATAIVSSLVNTQFQYIDVGVNHGYEADGALRPRRQHEDQD